MFERFTRSWSLVKASADVLRQDKELLVFPLISTIASLVVVASFVLPAIGSGAFAQLERGGEPPVWLYGWMFAFYLVQYFVIFFFNAALVGAALIRLRGGDPTVADGFRIAASRIDKILGYAVIAATVGMILRLIEERVGTVGKWIVAAIGAAWTVATFLAVPVLVSQNVGPIDAVKRSVGLLKMSWGENVIGNAGVGLVFFLFYVAVVAVGIGLVGVAANAKSGALAVVAMVGTVVAILVLALVQAALQGVYAAALYRYAEEGEAGGAFDGATLQGAFRPK